MAGALNKPAFTQTKRRAVLLQRLGLPACLIIAWVHPTMLWSKELPPHARIFAPFLSIGIAAVWFMLGLAIYRLNTKAPVAALSVYLVARIGHAVYAAIGGGTPEGVISVSITIMPLLLLSLSVYGMVQRNLIAQRAEPYSTQRKTPVIRPPRE